MIFLTVHEHGAAGVRQYNAIYFVAVGRKPSGFALEIVQKNRSACADTANKISEVDGVVRQHPVHAAGTGRWWTWSSMANESMFV